MGATSVLLGFFLVNLGDLGADVRCHSPSGSSGLCCCTYTPASAREDEDEDETPAKLSERYSLVSQAAEEDSPDVAERGTSGTLGITTSPRISPSTENNWGIGLNDGAAHLNTPSGSHSETMGCEFSEGEMQGVVNSGNISYSCAVQGDAQKEPFV